MGQKTNPLLRFFLVLTGLIFQLAAWAQDGQTLSFTVTNGAEERCAVDSLVNITIDPNPDLELTQITLSWGDGSSVVTLAPGDDLDRSHTFPGESFFESCNYDSECVALGFLGFCFDIKVIARYSNGSTENVTKTLTFQVPPRPNFTQSPSVVCVGENISFSNTTCPGNDPTIDYTWSLPGGEVLEEEDIGLVFPEPGTFPLMLHAENICGEKSITKNIEVQALPEAISVIDSGSVNFDNNTYQICLGDGGIVRLNGDSSISAESYRWSISSNTGIEWIDDRNQKITRLNFNQVGTYTITLRVDNGCNEPDETDFQVEVLDASSLSLQPQADVCLSLSYQPEPINPEAIYRIDGQVVSLEEFPLDLPDRSEPYIVEASLPGVCGDLNRRDTFRVFAPTVPALISPGADTSVCSGDGRLLLLADPPGGRWLPNDRLAQDGNQYFFKLDGAAGETILTYVFGSGDCAESVELKITTQSVNVDIGNPQEILCIDTGQFQLTANPGNGQWSGLGTTDNDLFDPAIAGEGEHLLTYKLTDTASGCTVERQKTMIVNPLPTLDLVDSTSTCLVDDELSLPALTQVQVIPDGGTYNWQGMGVSDMLTGQYNPSRLGGPGRDTVSLSYTSPAGCQASAGTIIQVEDLTQARTIPDSTVCLGVDQTLTLTGFPGGGTWTGPGIDSNTGIISLSQVETGSFDYEYTIQPGTTCESSDASTLTFVEGGAVNAGADLYVCESENVIELNAATPMGGTWSGPELNGANQVNIQNLAVGDYEFVYRDPSLPPACNSDALRLVIDSLPTAGFQADTVACLDAEVELTAAPSSADRWQWDLGNQLTRNEPVATVAYEQTGNFTITLTTSTLHPVNGEVVCQNSFSRNIFITEPPPLVDFTVSETEDCGPLTISLDNLSSGDFLAYSWRWGPDSTSTSIAANPGPLTFQPGQEDTTYTVSLTAGNLCGQQVRTVDVTVLPLPKADFGVDFAQPCSGDTLLINNTSTGNPANNLWTIEGSNSFDTFNPPILRPKTDTLPRDIAVQLITSNSCGIDSITRMITVYPTDVRALINIEDKAVCVDDTLVLASFSTPGSNLSWQLSTGDTFGGDMIRPVLKEPGLYQATLFAERCGYDSTTVEFEVLPLPEVSVSGDFQACEDAPAQFSLTSSTADHTLYLGTGDSSLLNNISYVYDTAGVYQLAAVATSAEGCRNGWAGSVLVESKPTVAFGFMDSLCARTPVQLQHEMEPGFSCSWLFDGSDPSDDCTPEYVFETSGLHPVRLTVSSPTGCRDSLTEWVYVRPTPVADFAVEIIDDCTPAAFRFEDQSVNVTGLTWNFGDGAEATVQKPEHVFDQPGVYPVQLTASYDGICTHDVVREVTVFPTPRIQTSLEENCTQAEGADLVISSDIPAFFLLSNEEYAESGDQHQGLQAGTYQIRAESDDGCIAYEEITVSPVQELEISLPQDSFSIQLGESVKLVVQANLNTAAYNWTPAQTLDDPALSTPLAAPLEDTDYEVVVTDERGCSKMETLHVEVDIERVEGIYLPNAFTPDGSGHNDVFRLRINNPSVRKINVFRVFDRWGELVFEALDCPPDNNGCGWDGYFRGKPAAADVYVFYVEIEFVDGLIVIRKGQLNLLR